MFGLGFLEIIALAVLALIVLGPKRFPSFIKEVLKFLNQIKSVTSNVQKEIKDLESDIQHAVKDLPDSFSEEQSLSKQDSKDEKSLNPKKDHDK